jgi:hypothetical protein
MPHNHSFRLLPNSLGSDHYPLIHIPLSFEWLLNFSQPLKPPLFHHGTATTIFSRRGGRNFSVLGPRAVPKILTRLDGG